VNAPDMKARQYDRTTEDVGNIVHLEHVNMIHNDQRLATLFYVVALGGTRDPYIFVGLDNMWVNFGRTQVHLPSRDLTAKPQVQRGVVGFVVPDLEALKKRLKRVEKDLQGTQFSWKEVNGAVETTCPWGNRFCCHAPSPEFGPTELALAYVDYDVPQGTADGIARFYSKVMGAPGTASNGRARISVGQHQSLYFSEKAGPQAEYDGHHFAMYIADFSRPYKWLLERDLISMEMDAHEWRLQWITDPDSLKPLFQIEHEVRSLKHPLYARPLVNRNHATTNTGYVKGMDPFKGTY
jgi:hypothetical protein